MVWRRLVAEGSNPDARISSAIWAPGTMCREALRATGIALGVLDNRFELLAINLGSQLSQGIFLAPLICSLKIHFRSS